MIHKGDLASGRQSMIFSQKFRVDDARLKSQKSRSVTRLGIDAMEKLPTKAQDKDAEEDFSWLKRTLFSTAQS